MTRGRTRLPLKRLIRRAPRIGLLVALAAGLALTFTTAAQAATATAALSAGSLAFKSTPPDVSFSATLSGADQTTTASQALDVGDATGSGAGWNITATSTTFTKGSDTLANDSTTVQSAPSVACDAGATCTLATPSGGVSYPYTLPAATVAPTATKMFSASPNSGRGNQTVTPSWRLAVPASALAGSYTSTWTLSLSSGP